MKKLYLQPAIILILCILSFPIYCMEYIKALLNISTPTTKVIQLTKDHSPTSILSRSNTEIVSELDKLNNEFKKLNISDNDRNNPSSALVRHYVSRTSFTAENAKEIKIALHELKNQDPLLAQVLDLFLYQAEGVLACTTQWSRFGIPVAQHIALNTIENRAALVSTWFGHSDSIPKEIVFNSPIQYLGYGWYKKGVDWLDREKNNTVTLYHVLTDVQNNISLQLSISEHLTFISPTLCVRDNPIDHSITMYALEYDHSKGKWNYTEKYHYTCPYGFNVRGFSYNGRYFCCTQKDSNKLNCVLIDLTNGNKQCFSFDVNEKINKGYHEYAKYAIDHVIPSGDGNTVHLYILHATPPATIGRDEYYLYHAAYNINLDTWSDDSDNFLDYCGPNDEFTFSQVFQSPSVHILEVTEKDIEIGPHSLYTVYMSGNKIRSKQRYLLLHDDKQSYVLQCTRKKKPVFKKTHPFEITTTGQDTDDIPYTLFKDEHNTGNIRTVSLEIIYFKNNPYLLMIRDGWHAHAKTYSLNHVLQLLKLIEHPDIKQLVLLQALAQCKVDKYLLSPSQVEIYNQLFGNPV